MKLRYTLLMLFLFSTVIFSKAQGFIDVEGGMARFGYNDVKIPGNGGTLFSLSDDFDSKISSYYRGRLGYTLKNRHTVSLLYAPLTIKSSGVPQNTIYFQGETFQPGFSTHYSWKFNSYRLSYHYAFIKREHFTFALGLTGKVRDARIALDNGTVYAEKTNLGIVPLIRFYTDWEFAPQCHLIVDGDALVGPQGRAEDILFAFGYSPVSSLTIKLGYRLLEGGADNDEVYNFSSVHYASLSVMWTFKK